MILMICGAIFITFYRAVWIRMSPWRESIVKILSGPHHAWLTQDILSAISAKHKAKCNAECTHDPGDVDHYKSIKNSLNTMIHADKLEYVRSLRTDTFSPIPPSLLLLFGLRLMKLLDDVSHINHLCVQICHWRALMISFILWLLQIDDHHPTKSYLAPVTSFCPDIFKFWPIQPSKVLSALQDLDIRKSAGPDGISAMLTF